MSVQRDLRDLQSTELRDLLAEIARLRDQMKRLREEMVSLVKERQCIRMTARLPLNHPARKGHRDELIARRRRRQNSGR